MTREDVYVIVSECIVEVLPEITIEMISPQKSLMSLGANSIDRVEIVAMCIEKMSLKCSIVEFGNLKSIGELIDVLLEKSKC